MIQESDKRTIVLFFYFIFVQEKLVKQLSHLVLSQYKNYLLDHKKQQDLQMLIYLTQNQVIKSKKKFSQSIDKQKSTLVKGLDYATFTSWLEFRKKATIEELTTLLWSDYFQIEDELLASGLKVSVGTLRHRVLHGMLKLGQVSTVRVVPTAT